jgi:hypothetical protein
MEVREYHWRHLPTGKTGTNRFTQVQVRGAGNVTSEWGNEEVAIERGQALELLNGWNRGGPAYTYWL